MLTVVISFFVLGVELGAFLFFLWMYRHMKREQIAARARLRLGVE